MKNESDKLCMEVDSQLSFTKDVLQCIAVASIN